MPSITSTETHELKSIADSHATIHIITESSRTEFRESLSETDVKLADLYDQKRVLMLEPEETRDLKKLRQVVKEINTCIEYIELAWVRRFLISTDLDVDGAEITPANIKHKAPKAFYDEVGTLINTRAELGSAEQKNCESPSISSAAEVTTTNSTTAEPAV